MANNKDTLRNAAEIATRIKALDDSACAATWDSVFVRRLRDDGKIEVRVDGSNKITGTHKKSNRPIDGQCTPGRPPRIHFTRTEGGCRYTYDGIIRAIPGIPSLPQVPPFAIIIGRVSWTGCKGLIDPADGDDDWVGTHTT